MPAAFEMSRIEVPSKPFSRNNFAETRNNSSRRLLSLLRRAARGLDFIGSKLSRSFPRKRESSSWPWVPAFAGTSGWVGEPWQGGRRLDLPAQQLRRDRLAEIVHAQRARGATLQRGVEHDLDRQQVIERIELHGPLAYVGEVHGEPLARDLALEHRVGRRVVGEQADVGAVRLVARTCVRDLPQADLHATASTSIATRGSIALRRTSVGHSPSKSFAPRAPLKPPTNGGPDSPSHGKSRPKPSAMRLSDVRMVMRMKHSLRLSRCAGSALAPSSEL